MAAVSTAANCEALFAEPDIDGALIGGASLKVAEFSAICTSGKGLNMYELFIVLYLLVA